MRSGAAGIRQRVPAMEEGGMTAAKLDYDISGSIDVKALPLLVSSFQDLGIILDVLIRERSKSHCSGLLVVALTSVLRF